MKSLMKILAVTTFCFAAVIVGTSAAIAGCMDNPEDAIAAFFTGGASAAACELQELVDAIKNFIQTVSDIANNLMSNATQLANAAVGSVKAAGNDIANTVNSVQRNLGNAVSEANTMTSNIPLAANFNAPMLNGQGAALNTKPKTGLNAAARMAPAPILNQADPQQLHNALVRGTQVLGTLKSSVDQQINGRINGAIQQAGNQAVSHLSDVGDIVKTALLAPINALLTTLNDLVKHPTTLLDPIATINTMVGDLNQNIAGTMNHINDVITKDAIATLDSVESNVQLVQGDGDTGDKLIKAMRVAHQEKTKAALNALEAQLNAISSQQSRSRIAAMPAQAVFRFGPVQNKLHSALQQHAMPFQTMSSNLNISWARIKTLHVSAQPHPLDMHTRQTAQNQLDQMFRGKTPAQVASIKQDLLSRARMKFGSNASLMAKFEQNLNSYIQNHVVSSELLPAVKPPNPNRNQMLNPQSLPPSQGIRPGNQLPAIQK